MTSGTSWGGICGRAFRLPRCFSAGREAGGEGRDALQSEGGEASGGGELVCAAEVQLDGAAVGGIRVSVGFASRDGGGLLLAGEADMKERGAVQMHELPAANAERALTHHVAFGLLDAGEGEQFLNE